ncbi:hypothetical protein MRB53_041474 [Persea americana]|nr:hypothetical protein MRB53_041474 [Persea americana]
MIDLCPSRLTCGDWTVGLGTDLDSSLSVPKITYSDVLMSGGRHKWTSRSPLLVPRQARYMSRRAIGFAFDRQHGHGQNEKDDLSKRPKFTDTKIELNSEIPR